MVGGGEWCFCGARVGVVVMVVVRVEMAGGADVWLGGGWMVGWRWG